MSRSRNYSSHGFSSKKETVHSLLLSLIVVMTLVQNFDNTYLEFLTGANYEPLDTVSSSRVATLPDLCFKNIGIVAVRL